MSEPFIHLRVHSAYSLCEGAVKIDDLIRSCDNLNMPAVAVTDTNNMFGILEITSKCVSHGIQPIPGTAIDVQFENVASPIVLLAQNEAGYKNLMKLMTCFYLKNKEAAFIAMEDLAKHKNGIIALSGGARGVAGNLFLSDNRDKATEFLKSLKEIFRDNLYVEISRTDEPSEKRTEQFFVNFAIQNNIPLVATNEVFFLDESMHMAHDALLCIADSTYITVKDRRRVSAEHYLKSTDEMFELFSDIKEAVLNTSLIAKRCSFFPEKKPPMLPNFIDASTNLSEEEILDMKAREGLSQRLQNQVSKEYSDRLEHELELIKATGFSGYFLVVSDFVKWTKDNDIPVGPGRGSGAGSLV
ncbi:MAG: PHP domain-containing protein, partial [Holosporales bacterium]|nr:PHP domain-containing protein [Holosporales bacterium]